MSVQINCKICRSLPTLSQHHGGELHPCPVCGGGLIIGSAEGVIGRLVAATPPDRAKRRIGWIGTVSAAALLFGSGMLAAMQVIRQDTESAGKAPA